MIGIDLGTSKNCISVFQDGKVEIIPNEINERTTPSYVAFTENEKILGDAAKNQIKKNPTNTLFSIKRLLGRQFDDPFIQQNKKYWPFELVKDIYSGLTQIQISCKNEEKKYFVEEILALELQQIKIAASKYIGKEIKEAVIGVPNSFTLAQREMIKDAATISGLEAIYIISEPNFTSMLYGFNKQNFKIKKEENIIVIDLGAGFLSVSYIAIEEGLFEVKAQRGLPDLGGDDFDNRLIEYCATEFRNKTNNDIFQVPKALSRLRVECEKAKKALSSATQTTIELESLMNGQNLIIDITREKLEELCDDLFKKIISCVERLIKDANIDKSIIEEVILVGGSTRIPKIQSMLKDFFNGKLLNKTLNPEETVAEGAAIQAAVASNCKDEKIESLILLDVIPFSLGIEAEGGTMNVIIPKNSTIPCKKTIILTTTEDNQSSFILNLYEGDGSLTKDNHLISRLKLDEIPKMPKGKVEIEITFDIDAVKLFNVTITEKTHGKSLKTYINYELDRLSLDYKKNLINFYKYQFEKSQKLIVIKERVEVIFKWIKENRNAPDEEIDKRKTELIELMDKYL